MKHRLGTDENKNLSPNHKEGHLTPVMGGGRRSALSLPVTRILARYAEYKLSVEFCDHAGDRFNLADDSKWRGLPSRGETGRVFIRVS
jgi:hypothetical protein